MFTRTTSARQTNRLNNGHFEVVFNLGDERTNLFHQTFDGRFGTSLQQRDDGKYSDRSILVVNELLQINIATHYSLWMDHCDLVESSNSNKSQRRFGRRTENLKDTNGRRNVATKNNNARIVRYTSSINKPCDYGQTNEYQSCFVSDWSRRI